MVVTLASEVWALRERLAAMEAISIRQGALSPSDIDDYEFSSEQDAALADERKEFIANLFRVLQEQVDAAGERSQSAARKAAARPAAFGARIAAIRKKPLSKRARKAK
jgi:hypothetical protein